MRGFLNTYAGFLLRRGVQAVALVLLVVALNFLLIHSVPGDPVYLLAGQTGDEAYFDFIRAKFGLDQPLATQLWVYMSGVLGGDLGYSLSHQQPVAAVILDRIPPTLLLMLTAILLSVAGGLVLGVEAARREHSAADRTITTIAILLYSIPSFVLGQGLLILMSLHLGLFPAQGMTSAAVPMSGIALGLDVIRHLFLPAATLAAVHVALVMRLTRAEVLTVLGEGFVATARSKGLSEGKVLYRHTLRNALLPLATIVGNEFGMMLTGAVLVETVFGWPGLGRLMVDAIAMRDYPLLMGMFLLASTAVVAANLVTDLLYPWIDPRVVTR